MFPRISSALVSVGQETFTPTIDVLWRPDGGGEVRTWNEVVAVVNGVKKPVNILIGPDNAGPYIIPLGDYQLHNSTMIGLIGDNPIVTMTNGVVLEDLQGISAMNLRCAPSSGPCFKFNPPPGKPGVFFIQRGGKLSNDGLVPAIKSTVATLIVFGFDFLADGFESPGAPIVDISPTAFSLVFINFGSSQTSLPNNSVTGDPTSAFAVVHDGSLPGPFPLFTGFPGTVLNGPTGIGGGAGPTANRPVGIFGPVPVGCCYFDTTIAPPRPIFWDGAQWVDALGIGPV